jgi:hypothetical protein
VILLQYPFELFFSEDINRTSTVNEALIIFLSSNFTTIIIFALYSDDASLIVSG